MIFLSPHAYPLHVFFLPRLTRIHYSVCGVYMSMGYLAVSLQLFVNTHVNGKYCISGSLEVVKVTRRLHKKKSPDEIDSRNC